MALANSARYQTADDFSTEVFVYAWRGKTSVIIDVKNILTKFCCL